MRYLDREEVEVLHGLPLERDGGIAGIRDLGALEAALAQPRQTFGGQDLYPSLVEKATALAFSLIKNHPLLDGSKRIGHAAMETFLDLNGHRTEATVDEAERMVLAITSGEASREKLLGWVRSHLVPIRR